MHIYNVCVLQLEWTPDQRKKAVKELTHWEYHRHQFEMHLTVKPILPDRDSWLVILKSYWFCLLQYAPAPPIKPSDPDSIEPKVVKTLKASAEFQITFRNERTSSSTVPFWLCFFSRQCSSKPEYNYSFAEFTQRSRWCRWLREICQKKHVCGRSLSCVRLFATPWTVAHHAPLSTRLSHQNTGVGLPFPPPGDLPDLDIEATSPADSLPRATWETERNTQGFKSHLHTRQKASLSVITIRKQELQRLID